MRRRQLIRLLGGAALSPLTANAQRSLPVIGFMNASMPQGYAGQALVAFRQGLAETGFIETQNVTIEYHWAEGHYDRLPAIAADLVRQKVTVIAATSTPAALAAKAATSSIPIVFETAGDPVALGLVESLNRPGGNVTGVTQLNAQLVPKRLGLLHDLLPGAKTVGLLVNPKDPRAEMQSTDMQEAARTLGLRIHIVGTSTQSDIESAFNRLLAEQADALIVGTGELFNSRPEYLARLAARHRIPTMYQLREYPMAGGLMSYGGSITEGYRLGGIYSGRVLKGEKPSDLPVMRASKFELVINLRAANELSLTIPPGILAIADEVIE
jgi:putative tryptophan/tyrosine transport system substrate-binding protein